MSPKETLEGKLDVTLEIEGDGRLHILKVEQDTISDEDLVECMTNQFETWQLTPPPCGKTKIAKLFNLKMKRSEDSKEAQPSE